MYRNWRDFLLANNRTQLILAVDSSNDSVASLKRRENGCNSQSTNWRWLDWAVWCSYNAKHTFSADLLTITTLYTHNIIAKNTLTNVTMCVSIYITGDDGGENCVVIMMTPPLHIFWLLLLLSLKKEERGEKKNVHHRAQRVHTAGQSRTAGSSQQKNLNCFDFFPKNNKGSLVWYLYLAPERNHKRIWLHLSDLAQTRDRITAALDYFPKLYIYL